MPVETPVKEIWLPVVVLEGWYEVSSFGRIKRVKALAGCRSGRILKPYAASNGYAGVSLSKDGTRKTRTVHSLVMEAFVGLKPPGLEINHKDGDKLNNKLENLEYTTKSENRIHAYRLGLIDTANRTPTPIRPWDQGEKNPGAKLANTSAMFIRTAYQEGRYTQSQLAYIFGVSVPTISGIVTGKTWKYLGGTACPV